MGDTPLNSGTLARKKRPSAGDVISHPRPPMIGVTGRSASKTVVGVPQRLRTITSQSTTALVKPRPHHAQRAPITTTSVLADMDPLTLNFDIKEVEESFLRIHVLSREGVNTMRVGLVMGLVLFSALMIATGARSEFKDDNVVARVLIAVFLFGVPLICVMIMSFAIFSYGMENDSAPAKKSPLDEVKETKIFSYIKDSTIRAFLILITFSWVTTTASIIHTSALDNNVMEVTTIAGIIIIFGGFSHFTRVSYIHSCIAMGITFLDYLAATFSTDYSASDLGMALGLIVTPILIFGFGNRSSEIIHRRNFLLKRQMNLENRKLRKTVARLLERTNDPDQPVDLEAPIQKITFALNTLEESPNVGQQERNLIAFMRRVLTSNTNLFAPNIADQLQKSTVDSDTRDWLLSTVGTGGRLRSGSAVKNDDTKQKITSRKSVTQFTTLPREWHTSVDLVNQKGKVPLMHANLETSLKNVDDWNFDVIKVSQEAFQGKDTLPHIGVYIMKQYGLLEQFSIPEEVLTNFLCAVASGYQNNPYHSAYHATDVLSTLHSFIRVSMHEWMTDLEVFATLFSAIIHDLDHPGRNTSFLISTHDDLAVLYNDRSPLENHHACSAFRLLTQPHLNILKNLSEDEYKQFRSLVIEMVLATDLSQHFQLLSEFKNFMAELHGDGDFAPTEDKQRIMLMQVAMKCADVSNVSKCSTLYRKWTRLCLEEFYEQGDDERKRDFEISPFMDRTNPNVSGSQKGFMDYICLPLFENWCRFIDYEEPLINIRENRELWEDEAIGEAFLLGGDDSTDALLEKRKPGHSDISNHTPNLDLRKNDTFPISKDGFDEIVPPT